MNASMLDRPKTHARDGVQATGLSSALSLLASAPLGIAHGASFASEHAAALHFIAWFGFGALVFRERARNLLATQSLVFFCCSFASGLWWMARSLAESTALGTLLGAVTFIVCCVWFALLPALAVAFVRAVTPSRGIATVLALAAAVALADFARALMVTGFPWLQSGHAYIDSPLAALLPFVGTQGVGLIAIALALFGGALVHRIARAHRAGAATFAMLILALPALLSAYADVPSAQRGHGSVRFALLQPATDLDKKFSRAWLTEQVQALFELASSVDAPDVVVAPETAVPTTWQGVPAELRSQLQTAAGNGTRWRFGAFATGPQGLPLNVVAGLDAANDAARTFYVKQHLVPFAEYTPAGFAWFTDLLQLPMSERANAPPLTATTSDGLIHTICLDLLYPLDSDAIPADGGIIINHSNFTWSRDDAARRQFIAAARARAREYDKPVLIAANDGPTVAIDRNGSVLRQLPFRERGVLTVDVTPVATTTVYAKAGDVPFVVLATALIVGGCIRRLGRAATV